jgi:imidazoleglycerol phosphate dehydratase HisB
MAQQNPAFTKGDSLNGFIHTFKASEAITKDMIVELDTNYPYVKKHTTTNTAIVLGVALESAAAEAEVAVVCPGPIKKVLSDSSGITRGEAVIPGATAGYCTSVALTGTSAHRGVLGLALETADAEGEKVPVLMGFPGKMVCA